jgi:hypothetical protein
VTLKYEARYILNRAKEGSAEGCIHSLKLLLPDGLPRACKGFFQTSLAAAGMRPSAVPEHSSLTIEWACYVLYTCDSIQNP